MHEEALLALGIIGAAAGVILVAVGLDSAINRDKVAPIIVECVQIAEDYVLCDEEHLAKFIPMQP